MKYTLNQIKIVTAFITLLLVSACGQRGALYMPTVPPLPKPIQPIPQADSKTQATKTDAPFSSNQPTPAALKYDNHLRSSPPSF